MSVSDPSPVPWPHPPTLADAFVHIHATHTSLAQLNRLGTLSRERLVDRAVCPLVRQLTVVTYGGLDDTELADAIPPTSWTGSVISVHNQHALETALYQATVPQRVADTLAASQCRSALVYIDQHDGGDVAMQTARLLRSRGLRVGLVARCGYHWSWTVARDTAAADPRALAAAAQEGDLCRAADVVVATTRRIADALTWQHRLPEAAVRVVPNFVQPEVAVPSFSERDPGTILVAGRLSPEKRIDLLIRAVAMAARVNPIARLIVIGSGPERAALGEVARAFAAPVEFRDRVSHAQLLREMGRCNIYAQPSRFEGHPKTILEAMAMGAPTLVARAPGVDDEINPNVTGVVCGDAEADLCGAMLWLLSSPDVARRLGERAARDIRARLNFDTVFGSLLSAFREAMRLAGCGPSGQIPVSPVRWEQALLNAAPPAAAAQFATSIAAFAKRLDPAQRAPFLDILQARLEAVVDGDPSGAVMPPPRPDAPAAHR